MSEIIGARQDAAAPDVIKNGSIETFEADVLNASMTTPVIVDFWAEWCGPCKQLAPRLEKAVRDAKGKVRLVKIDIDQNQLLASQLRIQSIPTVYAFFQGRPVDGFQGAVPESEIKTFVSRLAALAQGDGEGDLEALLDAADAAFNEGDVDAAATAYSQIAAADPDNARALTGVARCHIALGALDRAKAALDAAPAKVKSDALYASVRAAFDLASASSRAGDLAALQRAVASDPANLQARFDLAEALIAAGDLDPAIDALLDIIARERDWSEGAARKKALTVFEALGPTHPLTLRGRRRLSSILFS